MKKVYNIIMYTAIFIACYCTYCKVITMTVDIYSSSKSILLTIIVVGVAISTFILILIRRLFRYFEFLMKQE